MGQKKRVAAVLPILLLALGVGTASASVVPRDTSDLLGSPAHSHPANGSAELFKRQHSGGADYCKMPDGRQICGPLCGSCPEGSCCRGTDMTCGAGPKYCENKCTPQFSIGSCSGKDNSKTRSHVYDWWELYGPGGSRHGRIQPPADFPKPLRVSEARDEDENPEPLSKSSADDDVSLLLFRQIKLEPNAMLPLDAVCNATASKPSGGCQSSCCLDGRCTYCDKCAPKANVSSAGCKWCMKLKKPVSPEGCLFRGDVCTLPKGMAAVNPLSGCKTGCCKNGKCTWCEDCYLGCKCRDLGQPLNPDGRCVTRTRTTSRTKTKTRTTTTVKGSGPGRGLRFESCVGAGMVALTFDDGPYGHTEELLNKLKRRGIKATFFVNGQNQWNIYDRANLIRRMRDEGHCIASHGWRHDNELALGFDGTLQNLRQISDAIESIVGLRPKLHRPPFGDYDQETQRAAALVGQDIIIWNVDTKDFERKGLADQMSKIRGETAGGSPDKSTYVVLMHDIWQSTVDELVDPAIDYFASQGYHFVDMGTCRTGTIAGCYQ